MSLCHKCFENGKIKTAVEFCNWCEEWFCAECWGEKETCIDRGCRYTRNGDGWPPVYEKIYCDGCIERAEQKVEEENEERRKERESENQSCGHS